MWMTSCTDGLEHALNLTALEATRAGGRGRALCDTTVAPAALSAPPGPRCRPCSEALDTPDRHPSRSAGVRGRWSPQGLLALVALRSPGAAGSRPEAPGCHTAGLTDDVLGG